MSELSIGESTTLQIETLDTVIRLSDEVRQQIENEVSREIRLVEKARAYAQAAFELAHVDDEAIGDIFGVGESGEEVAKFLPQDNIYELSDPIYSIKGEFGTEHPVFSDYDSYFSIDVIDLSSPKVICAGYGERHPEHGVPMSKFAFILDRSLPVQDVRVLIAKDTENEVDDSSILGSLIEELRTTTPSGS